MGRRFELVRPNELGSNVDTCSLLGAVRHPMSADERDCNVLTRVSSHVCEQPDVYDSLSNMFSSKRSRSTPTELRTVRDVLTYMRALVAQTSPSLLDMNVEERNKTTRIVKRLSLTILPKQVLREWFMEVFSLRSLNKFVVDMFGTPPYHFLRSEDAFTVNASGIVQSRRNMTYETNPFGATTIDNYAQFSVPIFVDQYGREYKPQLRNDLSVQLEEFLLLRNSSSKQIMILRIKKVSRTKRNELMKTNEGRLSLSMPSPGNVIVLQPSSDYLSTSNMLLKYKNMPSSIPQLPELQRAVVRSLRLRESGSSTAEITIAVQ